MPGLAHFCEHMLFYASEKYPEEDAYSRFLVCALPLFVLISFLHFGSQPFECKKTHSVRATLMTSL